MKESLKLKLLRVAANNASCTAEVKSLLDFITKDEKPAESKRVEVKTSLEDGVYVVFSSGEIKPVSEYNEQCEPAKVLMIYRDHSWIVAPRDAECGETTLLKEEWSLVLITSARPGSLSSWMMTCSSLQPDSSQPCGSIVTF